MSKLTKDIRERMARKLVNHRYKAEAEALVAKNQELFERAYTHYYNEELINAVKVIEKAFPNSMDTSDQMIVNAGGFRLMIGGNFSSRWVTVSQRAVEERAMYSDYRPHNITDEALIQEIKEYAGNHRTFDEKCQTAYNEAMSALNTMTTGKKLASAWPEAIPVIGDLIPADQRTLPVVVVSEINEKFGLPPKEEA